MYISECFVNYRQKQDSAPNIWDNTEIPKDSESRLCSKLDTFGKSVEHPDSTDKRVYTNISDINVGISGNYPIMKMLLYAVFKVYYVTYIYLLSYERSLCHEHVECLLRTLHIFVCNQTVFIIEVKQAPGYKTFSMLYSTEQEILTTHKNYNSDK